MELQPLTNSDEFNFSFPNTNLTAVSEATAHTTRIPVPTTNAPIFTAIPATRKFVKLRPRKFVIAQNPELACRNLEAEIAQTVAAHTTTTVQVKENKDVERFVLSHLPPGSIRRAMQAGATSEQIRRSVMSSVAVLCGTTEEEGSQEGLSEGKEDGMDFEKKEMPDNTEKRNEVNFQQKGVHEEQECENIEHRMEINENDQESEKPHKEEKKKEGSGSKGEVEKEGSKSGEYNEDDDSDQALYKEIYDELVKYDGLVKQEEEKAHTITETDPPHIEIYDKLIEQEKYQDDDQALYAEIYEKITKEEEQDEDQDKDEALHTEAYEDMVNQEEVSTITGNHPPHIEIYDKLVDQDDQNDQDEFEDQALYAEMYEEMVRQEEQKRDQDEDKALYAETYEDPVKGEACAIAGTYSFHAETYEVMARKDEDQLENDSQALCAEIYGETTKQEDQDEDQDDDQALYAEISEDMVKGEAEAYTITGTDPLHAEIYKVMVGEIEGQVENQALYTETREEMVSQEEKQDKDQEKFSNEEGGQQEAYGKAEEVGKETNIQGKREYEEVPEDGLQAPGYLLDFEDFSQEDCDWVIALLDASPETIEDATFNSVTATNVSLLPIPDANGDTDSTNLGPKNDLGEHDNKDAAHDTIDTEANDIFSEAKEFFGDISNVETDEAFLEVRVSTTPSTLPEINHRIFAYWLFLLAIFSFATDLAHALARGIARSLAMLGRCTMGILLLGMRAMDLIQRLATILAEVVALAHFAKVVEGPLREAADGTDYEIIVLVVEKFNRGIDTGIDWAKERYGLRGVEKTAAEERQGIQEVEKTTIAVGTCDRDSWVLASPLPVPVVGQAVRGVAGGGVGGGAAKSPDGLGLFLLGFFVLGRRGRGWRRRRLGRA